MHTRFGQHCKRREGTGKNCKTYNAHKRLLKSLLCDDHCSCHFTAFKVQRYSTTILSAMMAGMDDKEDPEDYITIEAMSGLSRVLSEIDESHIRAILINVALKIRPCFEKVCTKPFSGSFRMSCL